MKIESVLIALAGNDDIMDGRWRGSAFFPLQLSSELCDFPILQCGPPACNRTYFSFQRSATFPFCSAGPPLVITRIEHVVFPIHFSRDHPVSPLTGKGRERDDLDLLGQAPCMARSSSSLQRNFTSVQIRRLGLGGGSALHHQLVRTSRLV